MREGGREGGGRRDCKSEIEKGRNNEMADQKDGEEEKMEVWRYCSNFLL